jgi:UDPglucose 6-dehydrogenase
MTDWPEFARLDFTRVKAVMSRPVILDGRNLLSDLALADMGFTYLGIGR